MDKTAPKVFYQSQETVGQTAKLKTEASKLFIEAIIIIKYNQLHITYWNLVLLGDLTQVVIICLVNMSPSKMG